MSVRRRWRVLLAALLMSVGTGALAQGYPGVVCELQPGAPFMFVGSPLELYASCTGNTLPTTYVWVGCTATVSYLSLCTTTSTSVGPVTYSVTATDANGTRSAIASTTVLWIAPQPPIACSLTSDRSVAVVGSTVTLTANCINGPVTKYGWDGCESAGATCTVTSNIVGRATYSVAATNGVTVSDREYVHVDWVPIGPVCTVIPSSASPVVGQSLLLTAACSGSPSAYHWTTCTNTTGTCAVTAAAPGTEVYSVVAENSGGSGLRAGISIDWRVAGSMACDGSPTSTTAEVGQGVPLQVSCAPAALAYAWTQCQSLGASCVATTTTPGTRVYSVTAQGNGNTAVVTNFVVDWRPATPQVPTCTLVPSTIAPVVGGMLTLTAVCGNEPDAYFWSGCLSNIDTCQTANISADLVRYSVFAANKVGFGDVASVSIKWLQGPGLGMRAIEYYHAGLDHYFMTASLDETSKLDAGVIAGWKRTGESLAVVPPGLSQLPDLTPVCRFYGNPAAGLDSHFYSASPAECAKVQANFPAWLLESTDVFQVYQLEAATGLCPAATLPVYRLFNQRSDANHRYTTSAAIFAEMLARGYVAEGSGSPPVVFCAAGS